MDFERDLIVGAVVLAIALVAIASPFLLYVSGRLGSGSGGGVNVMDIGSLASSIIGAVTHFRFASMGNPTLVKEEVINVTGPLTLNIIVRGGGVSVLEWGEEGKVKVDVFKEERLLGITTSRYEYRYVNGVLNLTAISGYIIKVYVPPNRLEAINAKVSSGGFKVDVSDASVLRVLNATISGGGADLKLGKLVNLTVIAVISGGGLDGHLSFLGDVERSVSSVKVSIAGGGADLRVEAPNHAFKATCSTSGGVANLVVRGMKHVALNGNATYEDPDYASASRKLYVSVTVSGGGADVWLSG